MVRYTFNKRTTHCCRRNISSRVLLIFFSRASIKRCVKWIWNSRRRGKREREWENKIFKFLIQWQMCDLDCIAAPPMVRETNFPQFYIDYLSVGGNTEWRAWNPAWVAGPIHYGLIYAEILGRFFFFKLFVWRKVKHVHISSKSFCICNSSRFFLPFSYKKVSLSIGPLCINLRPI